jgi:hypothetical protein
LTSGNGFSSTVSSGDWAFYSINVPSGVLSLNVQTTNATGDVDLYILKSDLPSSESGYYNAGAATSSGNETATISSPSSGTYYIGIYGKTSAGYGITATNVFPAKPVVSIVVSDASAGEPANNGYFTVSRTGGTTAGLRVYYGTSGSTATSGSDYAALPGYVDISSGQTSALISVVVIDDSTVENSETVKVTLSSNTSYDIDSSHSNGTVTIADNDATQPVLSVSPDNRDVSKDASSTSFSVSNAGTGTMSWTAVSGSSWLTITSGSSGTNSGTISVSYTQNTGTSPRIGSITVTAPGATGSPKSVTVTQASGGGGGGDTYYTLTVNSSGVSSVSIGSSTGHGGVTPYNKTVLAGTSVNLQAPQYVGSGASRMSFTGWSSSVTSSGQSISFTMNDAKTVTANYVSNPEPVLCPMTVDLNHDGIPSFRDFSVLAKFWQNTSCTAPDWCDGSDFDKSGTVDIHDLQIFAEFWLWPVADVDMNREVNFTDYGMYAGNWLDDTCSAPDWCGGTDFDQSGRVDFGDFAILARYWVEGMPWPGDFNADDRVDFVDYAKLSSFWSATCSSPLWCGGADMNKSGKVDWADFEEFAQHWLEGM